MHDLAIRGGTVVDGTGADARTADVAIDGGRLSEVGRVDGDGRCSLDADGLVVAPGWVDSRAHYRTTLVTAEVTFEDGRPTGARPGRLVREC